MSKDNSKNEKHYVLYQWHRDGAKTIIIHGKYSSHDEARSHFEKYLYKMSVDEHISFPIAANSDDEAILIAGKGNHWALA